MNSVMGLRFVLAAAVLAVAAVAFTTFERPSPITVQRGYRGTGMDLLYNPRILEARNALQTLPEVVEAAEPDPDGPRASEIYQNVQVLGNLSAGQFGRVMQAMTNWVSPEGTVENGGCTYCHNAANFAADSVYTKVVARRMLQMVREINGEWAPHVQPDRRDLLHLSPRPAGAGQLLDRGGTSPDDRQPGQRRDGRAAGAADRRAGGRDWRPCPRTPSRRSCCRTGRSAWPVAWRYRTATGSPSGRRSGPTR